MKTYIALLRGINVGGHNKIKMASLRVMFEELSSISYAPEAFKISRDVTYLFAANGYGKTKLNNNFFEKKLLCEATTRNLRTMHKLLDLCAEMT